MRRKTIRRVLVTLLCMAMLLTIPAMAVFEDDEIPEVPAVSETDTVAELPELPVEAPSDDDPLGKQAQPMASTVFSVTVPTTVAIHMDASGGITCGDIVITNNSTDAVLIKDTQVSALNGWTLVDYATTTFTDANKGQHKVALQLSAVDGTINSNGGSKTIGVAAKIPRQGTQMTNAAIGMVTFIVGWEDIPIIEGPDILEWNSLSIPTANLSISDGTSGWTWSSSNPNIVSASSWGNGYVTAKDIGKATICASKNGVTLTKTLEVTWDKNAFTGNTLPGASFGFLMGGEIIATGGHQVTVKSYSPIADTWYMTIHGYQGSGSKVYFEILNVPPSAIDSISTNVDDFVLNSDGVWISERVLTSGTQISAGAVRFK